MTADQYRAGLQSLELTQIEFGKLIGVSPRTAQAYAAGGPSGPAAAVMIILSMVPRPLREQLLAGLKDRWTDLL